MFTKKFLLAVLLFIECSRGFASSTCPSSDPTRLAEISAIEQKLNEIAQTYTTYRTTKNEVITPIKAYRGFVQNMYYATDLIAYLHGDLSKMLASWNTSRTGAEASLSEIAADLEKYGADFYVAIQVNGTSIFFQNNQKSATAVATAPVLTEQNDLKALTTARIYTGLGQELQKNKAVGAKIILEINQKKLTGLWREDRKEFFMLSHIPRSAIDGFFTMVDDYPGSQEWVYVKVEERNDNGNPSSWSLWHVPQLKKPGALTNADRVLLWQTGVDSSALENSSPTLAKIINAMKCE